MFINHTGVFYNPEFIDECIDKVSSQPFWVEQKDGSIVLDDKMSPSIYLGHTLPALGFCALPFGNEILHIQQNGGGLVREVDIHKLKEFVAYVLNQMPSGNLVLDQMTQKYSHYFNQNVLTSLRMQFGMKPLRDSRRSAYRFYKNGVVEITRDGASLRPYSSIDPDTFVWVDQVINRDFNGSLIEEYDEDLFCSDIGDRPGHQFHKWLQNLCRNLNGSVWEYDTNKFKPLVSGFGYLLHQYWADHKVVCLVDDEMQEGEANGRTGKSVVVKDALEAALDTEVINAKEMSKKNSSSSSNFIFNFVKPSTQAITFDDCVEDFNFNSLFSIVTGPMVVNRKYGKMFEFGSKSKPKLALSSNHPILGDGFSYEDRQHMITIGNYYKYHKQYLGKTPDQLHGGWLFDEDWSGLDWQEFDALCVNSIRFYLTNGLVSGGVSERYKLNKLHASIGSSGLTNTLARFLEENVGATTYQFHVDGMDDDQGKRCLKEFVEESLPGETFTLNQLSSGLGVVANHFGYKINVGLKGRPQGRFGPYQKGVNKYMITSSSKPFGGSKSSD